MIITKGIPQGTLEWQALRRGRITGTKLGDVMGTPLDRVKLIAELIAEEGTEQTKVMRPTPEMERGSAEEVFARKAYEKKFKKKVEAATLLISDEHEWLAVSPDGLIKDKATGKYTEEIEIKNPNSATVIMYKMGNMIPDSLLSKKHFLGIPTDYKWQMVLSFIVNTDLERKHFVVYDARFIDDEHKMYVVTIERSNPELQDAIQDALKALVDFRLEWLRCKEIVLPSNF